MFKRYYLLQYGSLPKSIEDSKPGMAYCRMGGWFSSEEEAISSFKERYSFIIRNNEKDIVVADNINALTYCWYVIRDTYKYYKEKN